jgi:hypothetical protein
MTISILAIDIGKNSCSVVGVEDKGAVTVRRTMRSGYAPQRRNRGAGKQTRPHYLGRLAKGMSIRSRVRRHHSVRRVATFTCSPCIRCGRPPNSQVMNDKLPSDACIGVEIVTRTSGNSSRLTSPMTSASRCCVANIDRRSSSVLHQKFTYGLNNCRELSLNGPHCNRICRRSNQCHGNCNSR